jgi:ribosome-binding ATPase
MSLQVGIIGMPNVGKSTLLNALTHAHAEASNYPFCTIDRNMGVTGLEDPRLTALAAKLKPEEMVPASIQFVDIAGLVRGASRGEGLGNRFLGHVREADALIHVVRSFGDEAIVHVDGTVDPVRDCEVVLAELMLADLETVERHEEKVKKLSKGNPREAEETLTVLEALARMLREGKPAATLLPSADAAPRGTAGTGASPHAHAHVHKQGHEHAPAPDHGRTAPEPPVLLLARELCLLSLKPTLVVLNVDEAAPVDDHDPQVEMLRRAARADVLPMAIRLEEELSRMEPAERQAMARDLGLPADNLRRLVEAARRLLGLITFYTIANNKLRAWLVPAGTPAPKAAGRIHTDMERGFIRLEVFTPEDLLAHGTRAELHRHGLVRVEGRDYLVRDGDVVQVLFQAS